MSCGTRSRHQEVALLDVIPFHGPDVLPLESGTRRGPCLLGRRDDERRFACSPCRIDATMPSLMIAKSLACVASNSSATRGRPPVMSRSLR